MAQKRFSATKSPDKKSSPAKDATATNTQNQLSRNLPTMITEHFNNNNNNNNNVDPEAQKQPVAHIKRSSPLSFFRRSHSSAIQTVSGSVTEAGINGIYTQDQYRPYTIFGKWLVPGWFTMVNRKYKKSTKVQK